MTKEQIFSKYKEAATAESHGRDKWGRADNYVPIEFKFRQRCYTSAKFTEVGHNLVEVEFDVGEGDQMTTRKQVFFVQ